MDCLDYHSTCRTNRMCGPISYQLVVPRVQFEYDHRQCLHFWQSVGIKLSVPFNFPPSLLSIVLLLPLPSLFKRLFYNGEEKLFQKVEYGLGLIFKVVLEYLKRCSEPFLIYIYGTQCDFMPKVAENT